MASPLEHCSAWFDATVLGETLELPDEVVKIAGWSGHSVGRCGSTVALAQKLAHDLELAALSRSAAEVARAALLVDLQLRQPVHWQRLSLLSAHLFLYPCPCRHHDLEALLDRLNHLFVYVQAFW